MTLALLAAAAFATAGFDPAAPEEVFAGDETWDQDLTVKLWSTVERFHDDDPALFDSGEFNAMTEWKDDFYSPWIATMFGTARPEPGVFLLHKGLNADVASGTPILLVCGAGDNASRGFVTLATKLDRDLRPVYAITFAHPHGDVFEHAEVIADALAVIAAETGAAQVDVVAHSKGGIASVVYASNLADAAWPDATWVADGTRYRGDVRKLVLIATPLGGIDTAFRWPGNSVFGTDPNEALAPTSWNTYYPSGIGVPLVNDDLRRQDFLPDHGDLFPGQRQLLARQDYELPGESPWMGGYALQTDWYTSYEGGLGFFSDSDGIDAAVDAGGQLIAKLRNHGVDPGIGVYLLAGKNPLMPNGDAALAGLFGGISEDDWASFLAGLKPHGVTVTASEDELDGLQRGALILGEISGPADGLVFETSALDARAVDGQGAAVVETYTANLSHLDLLYASPITGQLLIDAADDAPENAWMRGVGERYIAADTLGWVERVLGEVTLPTGTNPTTDDTGVPATDGPGATAGDAPRPCGGCDHATAPGWAGLAAALTALARRRPAASPPAKTLA